MQEMIATCNIAFHKLLSLFMSSGSITPVVKERGERRWGNITVYEIHGID
jgi:hypothetical protein